jgi:hypothetical protein
MNALAVSVVLLVGDEGPNAADVKAGWTAFAIFIGLILAVAFLGWSLVRQLRKAQRARDAGVYGDEPVRPEDDNHKV